MAKLKLNRRKLLLGAVGGIGVQIGLPALAAMLNDHGTALAQGPALPRRFLVWFWGGGVKPARWVPAATGATWELSEQMAPLKNVKDYINVVSGTEIKFGNTPHHVGAISMMTGGDVQLPEVGEVPTTVRLPSMDQLYANALGTSTRFRSLEVGVLDRNATEEGDGIWYISHNGPRSPNPYESDPMKVFNRVFGMGFTPPSPTNGAMEAVDINLVLRKSVLDGVLVEIDSLKPRVGAEDLKRLDQHAENIRSIEKRLATPVGGNAAPGCSLPEQPSALALGDDTSGYTAVNRAMSDLVAMVLACDLTRVVTYEYSGGSNFNSYPSLIGSTISNHDLNHSEAEPQPLSNLITIFTMQQLAYFLETLKNTPEGAGNLLDSSGILCTSELSDAYTHEINEYPILVAGRAGGALRYPGVHYRSATQENANLPALTLLRSLGLSLSSFGQDAGMVTTTISAIEA